MLFYYEMYKKEIDKVNVESPYALHRFAEENALLLLNVIAELESELRTKHKRD